MASIDEHLGSDDHTNEQYHSWSRTVIADLVRDKSESTGKNVSVDVLSDVHGVTVDLLISWGGSPKTAVNIWYEDDDVDYWMRVERACRIAGIRCQWIIGHSMIWDDGEYLDLDGLSRWLMSYRVPAMSINPDTKTIGVVMDSGHPAVSESPRMTIDIHDLHDCLLSPKLGLVPPDVRDHSGYANTIDIPVEKVISSGSHDFSVRLVHDDKEYLVETVLSDRSSCDFSSEVSSLISEWISDPLDEVTPRVQYWALVVHALLTISDSALSLGELHGNVRAHLEDHHVTDYPSPACIWFFLMDHEIPDGDGWIASEVDDPHHLMSVTINRQLPVIP